jgi:hypothetical protein
MANLNNIIFNYFVGDVSKIRRKILDFAPEFFIYPPYFSQSVGNFVSKCTRLEKH